MFFFHIVFFVFFSKLLHISEHEVVLWTLILFLLLHSLFYMYLHYRQIRIYKRLLHVPTIIKHLISKQRFHEARLYGLHISHLHIVTILVFNFTFSCLEIYLGLYPFLWNTAQLLLSLLCNWNSELLISLLFAIFASVYLTTKVLPVVVYQKFVLEYLYNIDSDRSVTHFLLHHLKTLTALQIYVLPITLALFIILTYGGRYSVLILWLSAALCSLFVMLILPLWVDAYSTTTTSFQNKNLQQEVTRLAKQVGFPPNRIQVIHIPDGVDMAGNAYFYGICCTAKIVVYDTLEVIRSQRSSIVGLNMREVVSVVAHEMGHWYNNHYLVAMVIMQIRILITIVALYVSFHYKPLYEAVGFIADECPVIAGLVIAYKFLMIPYLELSNIVMSLVMHHSEYQADKFAHDLGFSKELQAAILKIYLEFNACPFFDSIYSKFMHTHPTMMQRVKYIRYLDERQARAEHNLRNARQEQYELNEHVQSVHNAQNAQNIQKEHNERNVHNV